MKIMKAEEAVSDTGTEQGNTKAKEKKSDPGMFSRSELAKDSVVKLADEKPRGEVVITPEEKAAFIDSVVNNTRFERDYSLFGGKITLTARSLTSEEVQALSVWAVKQGTTDPSGQLAGRHRKYLMAAQISKYNGIEMPPLEQPLFETLDKDGKTVHKPGWVERSAFWDDKGSGVAVAIMDCLADFDMRYSIMCRKAEDANFWSPDTP